MTMWGIDKKKQWVANGNITVVTLVRERKRKIVYDVCNYCTIVLISHAS